MQHAVLIKKKKVPHSTKKILKMKKHLNFCLLSILIIHQLQEDIQLNHENQISKNIKATPKQIFFSFIKYNI
ncbi:hypothetical protein BpHYR1_028370 [Brachionus plicatilis]|uniref:Uncharacterized protein n=1 Tax=Brachionus plicatilis TaxID=10195 RepID=A0A3M7T6L8_BRAPC|nr:hypothetical protein BpHYR1_028370 [Brachionus plicatilis]